MTNLIVATGVEHSATGLLARILATSGLPVLHRAMPHVFEGREAWWQPDAFQPCRFVVITRDRDAWLQSTVARGIGMGAALSRRRAADGILERIVPKLVVEYEALVANPDGVLGALSVQLQVPLSLPEPIFDGNARWRIAA